MQAKGEADFFALLNNSQRALASIENYSYENASIILHSLSRNGINAALLPINDTSACNESVVCRVVALENCLYLLVVRHESTS